MSPTDGAYWQSVILPTLLKNGRAGVQANTPGLCHLIAYMKIVKKFTKSDLKKIHNALKIEERVVMLEVANYKHKKITLHKTEERKNAVRF